MIFSFNKHKKERGRPKTSSFIITDSGSYCLRSTTAERAGR